MIVRKADKASRVQGTPMKAVDFRGWEVLGEATEMEDEDETNGNAQETSSTAVEGSSSATSGKRAATPGQASSSEPPNKKIRLSDAAAPAVACRAPQPNPIAQQVLERLDRRKEKQKRVDANGAEGLLVVDDDDETQDSIEGEGDLFLSDGWRERWCRCGDVSLRILILTCH